MPKLPPLLGAEVIRAFERLGYQVASQSGSHVKLKRDGKSLIVPRHKELKKGTLSGILGQAQIPLADLLDALRQ